MKKYIVVFLVLAVMVQFISAKEVFNRTQPGEQRIYSTFDFDPAPAITTGYAAGFKLEAINRTITVTGDISIPIFLLDLKHYRIQIGARVPVFNSQYWNVMNRFSLIQEGTDNSIYFGSSLGIEQGLLMGRFADKWYVAGEANYRKFLLMYMEHSDWYRENVYADAKDGWYGSTGGMFNFGIQGGYTFGGILEATLRLGIYKTEAFHDPIGLPFYANLGLAYHL